MGWPGRFHTGLHFTVLFEASYWAALTFTGLVHVTQGPQEFDERRLPRVGEPFTTRARVEPAPEGVGVVATGEDARGRVTDTLRSRFAPESRARVERAGLTLPRYLLDEMAP